MNVCSLTFKHLHYLTFEILQGTTVDSYHISTTKAMYSQSSVCVCLSVSVCILQFLTIIVCPGLTTFSSARLCRISLTAFSHSELPVEGSSPPRLPPCFPSSSSPPCSAPVSLRPGRKHAKFKFKMFPLTHSFIL